MNIPKMTSDGPMKASAWNALVDKVRSQRILPSVNLMAVESSVGTTLVSRAVAGRTPATRSRNPWDLVVAPDPEDESEEPQLYVTLIPGMLNGIMPSNWNARFPIQKDEVKYGVAIIRTDSMNITGITWNLRDDPPPLQTAQLWAIEDEIFYCFGVVNEGASLNFIHQGTNTFWYYYGTNNTQLISRVWMQKPRGAVQAGELPYEQYYYLA